MAKQRVNMQFEKVKEVTNVDNFLKWCKYKLQNNDSIPQLMQNLHRACLNARDNLNGWSDKDTIILDTEYLEEFNFNLLKLPNAQKNDNLPSNIYKLHVRDKSKEEYNKKLKKNVTVNKFIVSLHIEIYSTYNFDKYQLLDSWTFYKPSRFLALWDFARKDIANCFKELVVLINVYNSTKAVKFDTIELEETEKPMKEKPKSKTQAEISRIDTLEGKVDNLTNALTELLVVMKKQQ